MEITAIKYQKGSLTFEIELSKDGSYSIDVDNADGERIATIRTSETNLDDLIAGLKFSQTYNFIQD
jgi:hypothetical protein